MANVKVTVTSSTTFYNEVMDETTVAAYVAAANTAGFFENSDSNIFIPFANGSVVVNAEAYDQADREDAGNFGPGV
jgi:hypothetical protein